MLIFNTYETSEKMTFIGVVVKGLGKAALFTEMPVYLTQFKKKLGFKPFPGTLNLRVEPKVKRAIRNTKAVKITGKNVNGSVECFAITVNGVKCFAIFPKKSTHAANVVEVLSKFNLRKKLRLRNGCRVRLKLS